jgi:hypothetical protein
MPLIVYIFTIGVSLLIGVLIANLFQTESPPKEKKILVKTTNQVASMLAEAIECPSSSTDEDKNYLLDLLVRALIDDNHPDVLSFHHIGDKVINGEHPSIVWSTWLIIALRRLSDNFVSPLPEPWFFDIDKVLGCTNEVQPQQQLLSPILPTASPLIETSNKDEILPPLDLATETIPEEADISTNSLESDSDDSQQLITEAGPLASPHFTDNPPDITSNYVPASKTITFTTEMLAAVD